MMMKKLPFLLLFSAFAFLSCSTDENTATTTTLSQRTSAFVAENRNNPYDNAGKTYTTLLEEYDRLNSSQRDPLLIMESLEHIANNLVDFKTLPSNEEFTTIPYQTILGIMNGEYRFENALNDSGLSSNGKALLTNFMNTLETQINTQLAEAIHAFILDFENNVLQANSLTDYELKVLLSTSSVARYANAENKDGENNDWIRVKTKITASLQGLSRDTASGVLSAAAVAVLQDMNN